MSDIDSRIDRVAALGDRTRRAIYRYASRQPDPVTREQVADALDLPHHVAKFHLDRLARDGLLGAEYRRPPGRGGPGAGRPAKVYRAVGTVEVSVPERRYDVAGTVLVRAVGAVIRTGAPVSEALAEAAGTAGREVGAHACPTTPDGRRRLRRLTEVLESCGFEPSKVGRDIVLANCPFERLADEDRDIVCGMNLSFVRGVLDGVGAAGVTARLDPDPDPRRTSCCVRITTS
jgi:predicted ArsR family transcriptional regulator